MVAVCSSLRFRLEKPVVAALSELAHFMVLLEKLTGLQLVKKFPEFHGTRRFITALTSAPHLSLSWASPIQSIYPHPTSWKFILILSTHLRLDLPSGSFPPVSPARPYTPSSSHPYAPHAQPISFSIHFVAQLILQNKVGSYSAIKTVFTENWNLSFGRIWRVFNPLEFPQP